MKKQILKPLFISLTTLALLFSGCKKDKVTQEDVINQQQLIDFVVQVLDASEPGVTVDSATVEIVNGGRIQTVVTDESGLAFFNNVTISSSIPVIVSANGYISSIRNADGTPDDYRQGQLTEVIDLYPNTGDNLVTVQGKLTIETDVTNRAKENVGKGVRVVAHNNNLPGNSSFITETDSVGRYELLIPVGYEGYDDIVLYFDDIYANQTVVVEQADNEYAYELIERPMVYSLQENATNNAIPGLPSAYATISNPTETMGSGLQLSFVPDSVPFTWYSDVEIINAGSGYANHAGPDTVLNFSAGANDSVAQIRVEIEDGRIINVVGFVNNNALYTSAPTISGSQLGGSGAQFDIQFQTTYRVRLINGGSGYTENYIPRVRATYYDYSGGVKYLDYSNWNISGWVDVVNGVIVNDDLTDNDTISNVGAYAELVSLEVIEEETTSTIITLNTGDINNTTGKIDDLTVISWGNGYVDVNPPTIQIVSLVYGTGATAIAEVDQDGWFDGFIITNPGSGYVDNVNDFADDGTTGDSEANPTFSAGGNYWNFREIDNVVPGQTYTRSAYYGTGILLEDFE